MKKFALLLFCFAALTSFAQNLKLETGKKITASTTTEMDMDMGVAGVMKISSATTSVININGTEENVYKGENTITKMKMTQDGMGITTSYDSESAADRDSELEKKVGEMLNKPVSILINKADGTVKDANPGKEKGDSNPMENLMGASNPPSAAAAAAFFVIPAGKKQGEKWTDSTEEEGMKIVRNYELQSINNGIATISLDALTKGSINKDTEGMQMTITINGDTKSVIVTDVVTGLVKSNTSKGTVDGTMDMMGQSLPLTLSMTTVTKFE